MKTAILATMVILGTASGHAMQLRAPANAELYTCAKGPLSRVSTFPERPAQCCDGKLRCPQFLSTTTIVKAQHAFRT
ncbi:MAG: hypothetical protein M3Y22_15190 [Pseudomonadota bacterium]|nr:hypothetical protein [Pseudomonadota bacterium]